MRSNYLFPKARSRLAPSLLPPPVQRGGSGEASGSEAALDLGRASEDRDPRGRARADNRPPVSGPMTFLGIFLTVLVPILIVAGFGSLLARLPPPPRSRGPVAGPAPRPPGGPPRLRAAAAGVQPAGRGRLPALGHDRQRGHPGHPAQPLRLRPGDPGTGHDLLRRDPAGHV